MCQNSVFIKNVSASEGVINFFVTYLAGVGRGASKKISDETGRGQKKFCDSNENVPDPYHPTSPKHPAHNSVPKGNMEIGNFCCLTAVNIYVRPVRKLSKRGCEIQVQ